MKLTIENGKKVNTRILAQQLSSSVRIVEEAHTLTTDTGVEYFPNVIEAADDAGDPAALQAICDAHSPAMSDAEEAAAAYQAAQFAQLKPLIDVALNGLLSDPDFISRLKSALE